MRRTAILAGLVFVAACALYMRSLPSESAFHKGRVYFFGSDSWYHMRRIHYAATHGLRMPEPDPLLNFPEGSFSQWGWLFDGVAAMAVKISGAASKLEMERVAAWVPAVLGALCVIPAFFLGALLIPAPRAEFAIRHSRESGNPGLDPRFRGGDGLERLPSFNLFAGFVVALAVALLPGHGEYTMLGNLDHHVLESLLFCLTSVCFIVLRRQETGRRQMVWSAATGASLFLIYFQHPVLGNLYAAVFWVVCLAEIILGNRDRGWWAPFMLAGLGTVPLAWQYLHLPFIGLEPIPELPASLQILRYSFFHPAGLCFFSLTLLLAGRWHGKSSLSPFPTWALAVGILVCAAAIAAPAFFASKILFGKSHLYSFTAENMPLLFYAQGEGFKPNFAHRMYGYLFLAFPLWWIWIAIKSKPRDYSLLGLTAAVFFLVMFQVRFVYLFSYAFALAAAWTAQDLNRLRRENTVAGGVGLALFACSFVPCFEWWQMLAQGSHMKYLTVTDEFYDAMEWLRDHSPKTGGFDDIRQKPDWSVLAQWDQGHAILYISERPVVADPFNHGMRDSAAYYAAVTPEEAIQILRDKKVRYILAKDMSNAGWHGVYVDFLGLGPSHPLSRGDWQQLFQMKLLTSRPIPGPDGKPSLWGHRVAYVSDQGKEAILEFDSSQVKDSK